MRTISLGSRVGAKTLCLVCVFGGCEPEARDPLVGTWLLETVSARAPDGTIDDEPYGKTPSGQLTYTANGRMQVILAFSDRPRLSADWRASPAEERAAAFATSLSYAGRYTSSDDRVIHHVEVSSDPNRVGTSSERTVLMVDGRLTLTTPPTAVGGSAREFSLTWARAPDPINPSSDNRLSPSGADDSSPN